MDADRTSPSYRSDSQLAHFQLCGPVEEVNPKLAWVNSICIVILLVGIFGSKAGSISTRTPPPIQEVIPAIVEPPPPAAQPAPEKITQEQNEQEKPDTPQVVVVTPDAPNINFAVPTIGNLVVPMLHLNANRSIWRTRAAAASGHSHRIRRSRWIRRSKDG